MRRRTTTRAIYNRGESFNRVDARHMVEVEEAPLDGVHVSA